MALYEKLMRELPANEAVYFADAVHPEYQSKPAFGWVKAGSNPAILSTAGRGRVNIHGALNLETFDAPFVEPITVDGKSSVQLLAKEVVLFFRPCCSHFKVDRVFTSGCDFLDGLCGVIYLVRGQDAMAGMRPLGIVIGHPFRNAGPCL